MPSSDTRDRAHEDFEGFAASEFGVLTVSEYRLALKCYLEGRRKERAGHARLRIIRDDAVGAEARAAFDLHAPHIAKTMEQHVADGEGRN